MLRKMQDPGGIREMVMNCGGIDRLKFSLVAPPQAGEIRLFNYDIATIYGKYSIHLDL